MVDTCPVRRCQYPHVLKFFPSVFTIYKLMASCYNVLRMKQIAWVSLLANAAIGGSIGIIITASAIQMYNRWHDDSHNSQLYAPIDWFFVPK